ncbi:MAG TPA: tetratricopeptide repeat protein [Candidatus Limnocylindrales bacterium]|nr:tetratricopeptide repeat protein [Candidatus Limnocylindrales bacterium]
MTSLLPVLFGLCSQSVASNHNTTPPVRARNGYSQEVVLLSCLGLMLVSLALTAFISRLYHKDVHVLADQWFAKGESEFASGKIKNAVVDYQNALVYSPGNSSFQFHLAQALLADGEGEKARVYLLNMLSESPGSGQINLALARIAASKKATTQDAIRYYNAAIYGVWEEDPIVMRWDVRRELCDYLLTHGMISQAEPEIIALAQEVPSGDVVRQKTAAALLLREGLWNRAFEEYRTILDRQKHDADALLGAGTALYQLGEYSRALGFLDQLPHDQRTAGATASMIDTARAVNDENPYEGNLSNAERARRAAKAVQIAQARAQRCLAQPAHSGAAGSSSELQKLYSSAQSSAQAWTERGLARNPAAVDDAMKAAFQLEAASAQQCGASSEPADRALLLIAQSQPGAQP